MPSKLRSMLKPAIKLMCAPQQWSESQYAEAKLYANKPLYMVCRMRGRGYLFSLFVLCFSFLLRVCRLLVQCHRLGGKPLHVVLVGPSASGNPIPKRYDDVPLSGIAMPASNL